MIEKLQQCCFEDQQIEKLKAEEILTDFILRSYIDGRISRYYYEKLKSYLIVLNS
jgi:hypothetical protein